MAPEAEHTFLFADLAGFSALTEAHGDEQAADLAERFCDSVCELLPGYRGERVKSIGDGLMLRVPNAAAAVRLAVRIVMDFGASRGFPAVRVGMHTGPAVPRRGDWYGATVNLAARVAELAGEREVLLTGATRDAVAARHPEIELRARGRARMRNIHEPVELFAAVIGTGQRALGYPRDPVCLMGVDPRSSDERETFEERIYHFCSPACRDAFRADPTYYARRRAEG